MSGKWDANIKLVYAVDDGGFFTADTVGAGKPFDVIANVEVGQNLMEFASGYDLWVSVRNLSQSVSYPTIHKAEPLTAVSAPLNAEIRVDVAPGWSANEGDVLEVIASFKVKAGIHEDLSSAVSPTFIVSA